MCYQILKMFNPPSQKVMINCNKNVMLIFNFIILLNYYGVIFSYHSLFASKISNQSNFSVQCPNFLTVLKSNSNLYKKKTCLNPECVSKLKINTTAHNFISISLPQFMLMILLP
ncbi:hypothetical protein PYW08_004558 [Mythimna loreyi]|uniref:Uncharacterized protein n=1 Tax=Mythimna loreyi TaxID=667449 RepID=A0ACC2QPU4_9NEOP|nr:hypothetical protein PYW08_004558 [Mythimna loreyi]